MAKNTGGKRVPLPYPVMTVSNYSSVMDLLIRIEEGNAAALRTQGLGFDSFFRVTDDGSFDNIGSPDQDFRGPLGAILADYLPMVVWRNERNTYVADPELTRDVMHADSREPLPLASILPGLKHPNPLFLFQQPQSMTHTDGKPGRFLGFHTTGAQTSRHDLLVGDPTDETLPDIPANASRTLRTDNTEANALRLTLIGDVLNDDGTTAVDMDMTRITVPAQGEFTVADLVQRTIESGFHKGLGTGMVRPEQLERTLYHQVRLAITHILYAVSDNAVIGSPRNAAPPVKGKLRPARFMPLGSTKMPTARIPGAAPTRTPRVDPTREVFDRKGTASDSYFARSPIMRHLIRYFDGKNTDPSEDRS